MAAVPATEAGHISIAGYVAATGRGGFTIDHDGLMIKVDMSGWKWQEDYEAFAKRRVVVSGPLRDVDLRARTLRPDAVYVSGLDIYYEHSGPLPIRSYVLRNAPISDFVTLRATVQSRDRGRLELEDSLVPVDVSRLPQDETARLHAGQQVQVRGSVGAEFWNEGTLRAELVRPIPRVLQRGAGGA